MKSPFLVAAALAVTIAGTGCTTLTVTRVPVGDTDPAVQGVRYALPKVFLKVAPAPDGTITVTDEYLPDADNTFAVDATSYLANYTLKVTTENGLLSGVDWKADSSAIAGETVKAAGEVAKGKLDADTKAAATAQQARIDADAKLADAELAVKLARVKYETLVGQKADPKDITAALIDLEQAQLKVDAVRAKPGGLAGGANADDPTADATALAGQDATQVKAPVLYALDETRDGDTPQLTLVPVTTAGGGPAQESYPTKKPPAAKASAPTFFPRGVIGIVPDKDGHKTLTIVPSVPLLDLIKADRPRLFRVKSDDTRGAEYTPTPPVSLDSAMSLRVLFDGVPTGDYDLVVPVLYDTGTGKPTPSTPEPLRVRVP